MASFNTTKAALYTAISATANAVVTTVNATSDSISMVNTVIDDAKHRQAVRSKWDRKHYAETYANEKAKEIIQQRQEIRKWLGDDQELIQEFQALLDSMKEQPST